MRSPWGVIALATSWLCLAPLALGAPAISGGQNFTLALKADGSVVSWGEDSNFQLGTGRRLLSTAPSAVPALTTIRSASCGLTSALALDRDGTVWSWGSNQYGALGDATTIGRSVPVRVPGISGMTQVSAGGEHSMALGSDGRVWVWGGNSRGQLGVGNQLPLLVPTRLASPTNVVKVVAADQSSYAITADGSVWAWGSSSGGVLGDNGLIGLDRSTPVRLTGISNVVDVAAGLDHALAITRDGSLWAWGTNSYGQVGDGSTTTRRVPVQITGISGLTRVGAGFFNSFALRNDGSVWGWGASPSGLGDGTSLPSARPLRISGLPTVSSIAVGGYHRFALGSDGSVWGWGDNSAGQLGDATSTSRTVPTRIQALTGVTELSGSVINSLALTAQGGVLAWGPAAFGHLGIDAMSRSTPGAVSGLANITAIAAGFYFSMALRSDGTVWEWGARPSFNPSSETLIATWTSSSRQVAGLTTVRAIAAASASALALRTDGTVWGWGPNEYGVLGDGSSLRRPSPVQARGLTAVAAIAAGRDHALALRTDGSVWAWGRNTFGQLGNGATSDTSTPFAIGGLTDIVAISAGAAFSLALKRDGTVWAWGHNNAGQLGDGSLVDRSRPVQVRGLTGITAIHGGGQHALALAGDGRLWIWGLNVYGQLGDGASADRSTAAVLQGASDFVAFAAGLTHTLTLQRDGSLRAWGSNSSGELGDGTFVHRSRAVVTHREAGAGSIAGNDWFLDLDPAVVSSIPADKVPALLTVTSGAGTVIDADIRIRAQDVGTAASVFVFAVAPVNLVRPAANGAPPTLMGKALSRDGAKADPVACVLAQLNSAGQLIAVTRDQLQAYQSGVLSAQTGAVRVINGASAVNIAGATFYVGYGTGGGAMFAAGQNRGVVTVPGTSECRPSPPQTGWWWNPAEGGRGFSLEVAGSHIFFAAFLYDESGLARWYVATGSTSLDGSFFVGDLLDVRNGQTLHGAYRAPSPITSVGTLSLAFNTASQGTLVWPGGAIPIERFNIVQGGLAAPPPPNQPESGWWWNPAESGRGFFIEWQDSAAGTYADLAAYMYDDAGNPVWYLSVQPTPDARRFSGNWCRYAGGQTLTGPYKPPTTLCESVAPVTIDFHDATRATMTLPGGRTTSLVRHRF